MKTVFISYRQTTDAERARVRAFGEHLRRCDVTVILDQFLLDDKPSGPSEGWDKWSSDRALQSEFVIIVGSESWFQCFEKTQPPGTGLGAACEADDLRTRIYDAAGVIDNIRVVLFDQADATHISAKIKRYHRFDADKDFTSIVRWLGGTIPPATPVAPPSATLQTPIPHNLPSLQPFFGREDELRKIADALDPASRTWGALIDGPGGMGKTSLAVRAAYAASPAVFKKIIFISLKTRELDDDGLRDLSGFILSASSNFSTNSPANSAATTSPKPPKISARACSSTPCAARRPSSSSTTSKASPSPSATRCSPSSRNCPPAARPSSPAAVALAPPLRNSSSRN